MAYKKTNLAEIGFWSPAVLMFIYLTISWRSPFLVAFTAVMFQGVGILALIACVTVADKVIDQETDEFESILPKRYLVGALLLVAIVWIAVQFKRDQQVGAISKCVNERVAEHRIARNAVIECQEEYSEASSDYSSEE